MKNNKLKMSKFDEALSSSMAMLNACIKNTYDRANSASDVQMLIVEVMIEHGMLRRKPDGSIVAVSTKQKKQ